MDDLYYDQEFQQTFQDTRTLNSEPAQSFRRIWLTWENLEFKQAKREHFYSSPSGWNVKLSSCSGSIGPGQILAIVGDFKCGKSLLLRIIQGQVELGRGDSLTGQVLVNGEQRGPFWRRLCGHVGQDLDDMMERLTVREHLKYRAELALPNNWPEKRRTAVIDMVLQTLDLSSVADVRIGKLNTGEKKRVKVAQILVGLPRVLLLDEPLEGMDATLGLEMMQNLQKLVQQRQMTLIFTTKQVRSAILPLLDRLLLLTKGNMIYYGSVPDAIEYFEQHFGTHNGSGENPLLTILDEVNGKSGRLEVGHFDALVDGWRRYAQEKQIFRGNYPYDTISDGRVIEFKWHRSWGREFLLQLRRAWMILFRDTKYWVGQTLLMLAIALIVAFSAFQVEDTIFGIKARIDVLFYTSVFFQFFPFIPFLFVCYRGKLALKNEREDSIARTSPAYLAIWGCIYLFRLLLVTIYTCIVYFIVGLRLPFNYTLVFWLTFIAESWVAMGMGYLLVVTISSMEVIETCASIILLLCIWFSGDFAFNPTCTWILRWISYLSPVFYAFNSTMNNEFDNVVFPEGGQVYKIGKAYLESVGYANYGTWASIGTLLGFGLLYMILGYFGLAFVTRPKRHYI